jgi:JAB N-terminal domain
VSAAVEVEVFRTDDYVPAWRIPLVPLLREVLEPVIGESLGGTRFTLVFLPVADETPIAGAPSMINLRSGYGYVHVRVSRGARVIYQHPHSMRELVGVPLCRQLSSQHPDETHWGFGVRAPGLENVALVRPAPHGDGQVDVVVRTDRVRRFQVDEIAEPEPPATTLGELGVPDGVVQPDDEVVVVVDRATHRALTHDLPFSSEVEEGGFLIGRVHRAAGHPDCYLVEVTGAPPAERTGASLLSFTFTGESFLRMGQRLASGGHTRRLVGWYHTHLFPATDTLGLSSIDVELHTTTFRTPWQVAGLINIEGARRVLRWYRADRGRMVAAPYWVAQR